MPATRIETRRGWIGNRRRDIIEAVQRALQTGLKISDGARCVRLVEYDDDEIITPSGKGPSYLTVEVALFSGRTVEAKRRFYAALAEELSPFGVAAGDIETILIEVDRVNWGLQGLPACDIDP